MSATPSPPLAQLTDPQIERVVGIYLERDMARYERAAAFVGERLGRELRAASFGRYLLTWRAKHPADLREKLRRKRDKYAYRDLLAEPGSVVTDLAGCRVIVYHPAHEEVAAGVVRRVLPIAIRPDADEGPRRDEKTGYRATHVLVSAPDEPETLSIRGAICEVQVTSLASHIFNELDHDIGYKLHGVKLSEETRALQSGLRAGSRSVDEVAGLLVTRRQREVAEETEQITTPAQLRHALEREFRRALSGEFIRFFQTLQQVMDPVTLNALKSIGDLAEVAKKGADAATAHGLKSSDDVINLMLGLMLPTFKQEFVDIARGWRGPTTTLKEAILRAGVPKGGESDAV